MKKFLINGKYLITAESKEEAKNAFDKISIKDTSVQDKLILDALCQLRGKDLEKVFTNVNIKGLKDLIKKYPEYKNKMPAKLLKLIKPVYVEKEIKIPVQINCTLKFKCDADDTAEEVKNEIILPAIQKAKFNVEYKSDNAKITDAAVVKILYK